MVVDHPSFEPPTDLDIPIWRYVSFLKFMAMIDTNTLFFSRADLLGDPFEGSVPQSMAPGRALIRNTAEEAEKAQREAAERALARPLARQLMCANCWHMNEGESALMWNSYIRNGEGIAIKSTYRQLKESIVDPRDVYLGKVIYIDYTGSPPIRHDADEFIPFLRKRKSFEGEREIRAIIKQDNQESPGLAFQIDLHILMSEVFIAPTNPLWVRQLVYSLLKKYGFEIPIHQSDLNTPALF